MRNFHPATPQGLITAIDSQYHTALPVLPSLSDDESEGWAIR